MARGKGIPGEIVCSYLEQYPKLQIKTLARKIFKENKGLWRTPEAVRTVINYYKGSLGKKHRKWIADKRFMVIPDATEDNKFALPDSDMKEWTPYVIPESCTKMLILCDLHIPYQDNDAISVAIDYGLEHKCDSVLLGGDLMDCLRVSKFVKDPNMRDLGQEIEATRHFLTALRKNAFPDAKIIYKEGNHEARIPRYGQIQAPELFGADFIKSLDEVLELDRLGVKWVQGKRPMYFGKLNVMHGDEYGGRSGGVNPARSMFLKTKECSICGHWHRTSQYSGNTIRDRQIATWTVGALCDMHPDYCPTNDWNLGFAVIERDDKDWFHVDNRRIINNKVV